MEIRTIKKTIANLAAINKNKYKKVLKTLSSYKNFLKNYKIVSISNSENISSFKDISIILDYYKKAKVLVNLTIKLNPLEHYFQSELIKPINNLYLNDDEIIAINIIFELDKKGILPNKI